MKNKTVILDVDDIILKFIEGFNRYLVTVRADIKIKPHYLPKVWGFTELGDISKEINEYINTYADGGQISCDGVKISFGKLYDGAADFTNKIKEMGHDVVLLTAHPSHRIIERINNLKSQGLKFDHIYCTAAHDADGNKVYHSKSDFIEALGYTDENFLFADDKAATIMEMLGRFKNADLFTLDRDYNKEALVESANLFDEDRERLNIIPGGNNIMPSNQIALLYEQILQKLEK